MRTPSGQDTRSNHHLVSYLLHLRLGVSQQLLHQGSLAILRTGACVNTVLVARKGKR